MKRRPWIFCIIMFLLVAGWIRRDAIRTALYGVWSSHTELTAQTEKNRQENGDPAVSQPEAATPSSGLVVSESQQTAGNPAEDEEPGSENAGEMSSAEESAAYRLALDEILARAQELREEYTQELDKLEKEAIQDYNQLPEDAGIMGFAVSYLRKALELEAACDEKMDAVLAELKALLKENGKSMELADTVKSTYTNEKSAKKAWYMSELQRRGFF